MTHDEILKALGSNPTLGLSKEEAASRLAKYGRNEVPDKEANPALSLAKKFWGLTPWMLELTMLFSFLLQKYFDVYIIGGLLVVNAAIGFVQEQKASDAVEALRNRLQVNARVLRGGKWQVLSAKELVPGDIVRVRAGDFVPADVKIIEESEIDVDQSSLTGESMTVGRKVDDVLYSGTIVKRGETNAIVAATGNKTYFGKTTELLQVARPKLHMEEITSNVVRWLLVMVGVLISLVLAASYAEGISILSVIPLALVLVVFAVPVALPAMFTVSMAIGSLELAKKGVLVTRLSASEDAASMDILCADKTGTITMNRLSVVNVIAREGYDENSVILNGALASQEANQDPIDVALISAARERNLPSQPSVQEEFIPFDPKTRRTEAVIVSDGKRFRVMKGAVDAVAQVCGMDPEEGGLEERMNDFAARGYKTLAVASSGPDGTYRMCGLVALYDMPRPDSKDLIRRLRDLGVSVKMLTGDALPIAKEIASQVGLGNSIVRAPEFKGEMAKQPAKAAEIAEKSDGFADVYPEDKYVIVKSLQQGRHVTGMTGDGVNDAPALRQAEVGIAVNSATDVAKGAASAVLTDEGLSNIVGLVEVGRMIYQRIVTWTLNKIVKTFQVATFIASAFFLTGYYAVSALDIILLLLFLDFVTISLSTDKVRWSKLPEKWNVIGLVKVGTLLGGVAAIESLGLLFLGIRYLGLSDDIGGLQTFNFAGLFYLGIFTVLVVRERGFFWDSVPSRTLMAALIADMLAVAVLVTVGIPEVTPIPITYLTLVFAYDLVLTLGVNDRVKHVLMGRFGVNV
ncbi:MAG: plasma-membrane proton-efflux P-type ATPase [Nitrososphaerota archaeon]|nr:plasma-membrane proton-efflux P-type ATPase [Nitrososphaerota archaeon]MDG7022918.1 plasma-membrane proton-efflux P-type ATPase [Nitrososphaerota archaeon]